MLKQTIYVDVLVSVNLIVDYFLLYAAAVLTARHRDRVRMCLGAVVGGAGSLTILLPRLPAVASVVIAVAVSALMTLTAFEWRGLKCFFRTMLVMYALSATYSGVMLLLWSLTDNGSITVNNGAVYISIDPGLLIVTTVVLYGAMSLFAGRIRSRSLSRRRCTVAITEKGRKVTLEGLVDTGNTLTEPFSGMPVIVVSKSTAEGIAPDCVLEPEKTGSMTEMVSRRIRMVPYHTAGGAGVMVAYRPERMDIYMENSVVADIKAYLAVAEDSAHNDVLLINPDILN